MPYDFFLYEIPQQSRLSMQITCFFPIFGVLFKSTSLQLIVDRLEIVRFLSVTMEKILTWDKHFRNLHSVIHIWGSCELKLKVTLSIPSTKIILYKLMKRINFF